VTTNLFVQECRLIQILVHEGLFTLAMFFMVISLATATRDSHYLLALATLGNATEIGSFLLYVMQPKVAKASTSVSLLPVIVAGIIMPPLPM
jgi:asparagine N-glycosylation enzyme membrane subunit Stt3